MSIRKKVCDIYAKGKYLDRFAKLYGLKRKRYFLFFKESDENLRERLIRHISTR